ncbi:MAG: transcriptional regulator [Clostridiales bacterium]
MAKSSNQKLKLLYIMKILLEKTDDTHMITMAEITDELNSYGVTAERKSIYDDIEALKLYGLDIEKTGGRGCCYYIANRTFELPELKLLVDAVQSSKFITARKSNELIKKVESFASIHEAQLLQRQVYVANRIKTMNESIYYNIDTLHTAISKGKKITFRYFEWVVTFGTSEKIKKHYRKEGNFYTASPWALTWDDENYYLVAFDSEPGIIKHFRVDKMELIKITSDNRDGKDHFADFDMAAYTRKVFGMFSGNEQKVKMRFHNQLIGVVLDRFGKDVFLSQDGTDHFIITTDVVVSPQFYGWLTSFGNLAKLIFPEEAIETYKNHLIAAKEQYEISE